jgi:hypothetical protein
VKRRQAPLPVAGTCEEGSVPLDDPSEIPSRLRPAGRPLGAGAPEDGNVALLIEAGGAVVVVTAVITQYVLRLAAASVRTAWGRRAAVAAPVDRDADERVRREVGSRRRDARRVAGPRSGDLRGHR